jgi:hypothetical protein
MRRFSGDLILRCEGEARASKDEVAHYATIPAKQIAEEGYSLSPCASGARAAERSEAGEGFSPPGNEAAETARDHQTIAPAHPELQSPMIRIACIAA